MTIKELSIISGFSVSTVSKALNNKLDVSKTTRKSIQAIAKELNYVPNNFAVALRVKKSHATIAVVLPEVTKKSYNQALCHVQKSAEDFGYRILLFQSFNSPSNEMDYIKSLNDGSTDGIIVISKEDKHKSDYAYNSIPIELLNIKENLSLDEIKELSYNSLLNLLID
ncbi:MULTISPECIES: LacI family DNA-binding transcriptional regulator [Winogradskyella]|uniref:LacI family DNA-binding transcriptional regulator n=1 Tax=Winogradskyella TaxID=286104 RepID=UPI0015C6ABD6|nr:MULTISPECIES: LacI family DNA-binding transcriptional regulator [Winogradskyella]QXP80281.1 LacI family DNA-binding transcriptional regulator [Winogradskyella sp. HaHa_3_26]